MNSVKIFDAGFGHKAAGSKTFHIFRWTLASNLRGVNRASICCYWVSATGNGGPVLSPELLGRLAKYNLTLSFDIHFESI
jgi:hypothetical protein